MAYFAKIENNIVTSVLAVPDSQEHRGQEFLANDLGLGGTWIQTSYTGRIRKHYAGLGYIYDATLDAFIPPKCHDEAVLDEATCLWICDNDEHKPKAR
jgi:hypothetical protein